MCLKIVIFTKNNKPLNMKAQDKSNIHYSDIDKSSDIKRRAFLKGSALAIVGATTGTFIKALGNPIPSNSLNPNNPAANKPVQYNHIVLNPNQSLASQLTKKETIYEINYVLDLAGSRVSIPSDCILHFNGGFIQNGILSGNKTRVDSCLVPIIDICSIKLKGTWLVDYWELPWFGCSTEESNASTNDAILSSLIGQDIVNIRLHEIYPITKTLTFTNKSGINLLGINRFQTGLLMTTDDKPIFDFHLQNKTKAVTSINCTFRNLSLSYKNWQVKHKKSTVFNFRADTHHSWGWQFYHIDNILCKNTYCFLKNETEPIWDFNISNVLCYDLVFRAIDSNVSGQLLNKVDNLAVLNYNHRTNKDHNIVSNCLVLKGEWAFNMLDIEDWWGAILYSDDIQGSMTNTHLERIHQTKFAAFDLAGGFQINSIVFVTCSIEYPNAKLPICLFNINLGKLHLNNLIISGVLNKNIGKMIFRYCRASNTEAYIITDLDRSQCVMPAGWGDKLYLSKKSVFNGVSNSFSSTERPTSFEVGGSIFDTTLKKPIWWTGTEWVDVTGKKV